MTTAEAKEILLFHSFRHHDVFHPKMESGFLGMLRPYQGTLIENNYHEIMKALKVLAADLSVKHLDKEIIASLWGICHMARGWAIDADGMLKRNGLIQPADADRLDGWINQISYSTFCLLDGSGPEIAFENYLAPE